jgi:hypothetical protein
MSAVIEFLRGKGRDGAGRRLAEVWAMNDAELERSHDFIHWLFPLDEPSAAVPDSPVLTAEDFAVIMRDSAIRAAIRRSFDRMLGFYGFQWDSERRRMLLSPHFPQQAANWLSAGNHNFPRITRILKCLMLIGEGETARTFLLMLEGIHKRGYGRVIGPRSLEAWQQAVNRRPDA